VVSQCLKCLRRVEGKARYAFFARHLLRHPAAAVSQQLNIPGYSARGAA
jgi:hypothetical protein